MTRVVFLASLLVLSVCGELVNNRVNREIVIDSNIARITNNITIESSSSSKVTEFLFALPPTNSSSVSAIFANQEDNELSVTETTAPAGAPKGATFYKVNLDAPIEADDEVTVEIEVVFTHVITPHPREITQKDHQLVIFYDNLHYYSPYKTAEESVTVTLASSTIEAYYPKEDAETNEATIKYSDSQDLEPFSFELFMAHYQNDKPFVVAETLQKTIQVSHWGALQVEEAYRLRHTGAKLTGSFSRLDMMRTGAPSSVADVTAVLPNYATDIYFRDVIGNISSSEVKEGNDDIEEGMIEVKMTQRFPLFGGWQTEFYYGYNLPLEHHLNITNGRYSLTFPYASPLKEMVTDDMDIKIVLPEGASNIKITIRGEEVQSSGSTTYTNLDTAGRPTFTITGQNVVSPDNDDIVTVEYNFDNSSLLQEPVLLTVGFFAIFGVSMLVNMFFF